MAKDIENPCTSVCQLNSELCVSCGRTKEDIRKWKRMKRPEKMAAVQRATLRLKSLQKKKLSNHCNLTFLRFQPRQMSRFGKAS